MENLSEIVSQIKNAVSIAERTPDESEKKLRDLVSPIWERFLKERQVGLSLQIREELTLANGRADTVFNKLILEYKKPHTIKSDNDKNRKLISQVQSYILDLAEKERFSKERLLGVAFDGNYFLFMRYDKRWIPEQAVPVNENSLQLFLKNLEKLTSKAALIPENLIRDFAVGRESRNKVAVDCIKSFYNELNKHGGEEDTKKHVFFEQWKVQFAEVHGSLEQKKIDKETLFTSYGFNKKEQINFNVLAFFFALDSYYALLIKLLSYQVVGFYTLKSLTGLPLHDWENLPIDNLRQKCEQLEEGGIFRDLGIRNFLEGDLFSWYTQVWNDEIYRAIQQIIKHLNDYDPETMEVAPDETRDILKKLYQYLVPKQIRHDLGEYYTPDWLAERCLDQLIYNGDPKYRILDPGCGSGTFLILAIKRAKVYGQKYNTPPAKVLENILRNICGFDLNPLAVISARTNYMLAVADLLKYQSGEIEITIPIYLCDSINPPQARVAGEMTLFPKKIPYEVKTTVGNFYFPHTIITKQRVEQLANIIEDCVRDSISGEDFLKKVSTDLNLTREEFEECELYLEDTYDRLMKLNQRGINGIWARIIKNAFAPLFVGKFDMVVGNPPWVNWESLPQEYRNSTSHLWQDYDLFTHKGLRARLGSAKDDISVLMTYVAIDRYLRNDGRLCFVITQSLFKTVGGGEGFRRFRLGEKGIPFRVLHVDDMVELQPFEGATNRTAVFVCRKDKPTTYPVPYSLWRKKEKGRILLDLTLDEVKEKTRQRYLQARSIDGSIQGPWVTAKPKALDALGKIVGNAPYQAREGVNTGGANGVLWIETIERKDNHLVIENQNTIGQKQVSAHVGEVEEELVFPLLRGRDISRWHAEPSLEILLTHDLSDPAKAIQPKTMQRDYDRTLDFLKNFEGILMNRALYKKYLQNQGVPFWGIYNIGPYTFAPYKVVWKEQSKEFQCAVISTAKVGNQEKIIVPDHKLMLVPFDGKSEAHFVTACLNSLICRFLVMAYAVSTQQSTHILNNIAIPQYDQSNHIHQDLSRLSQQCHEKTAAGIDVTDLEEQIDELAAEMWGLANEELGDIKDSLEILR